MYLFIALFSIFALSFRTILSHITFSQRTISHIIYDRNNNILAYEDVRYDIYLDLNRSTNITFIKLGLNDIPDSDKNIVLIKKNIKIDNVNTYKDPGIILIKKKVRIYTIDKDFFSIGVLNEQHGLCKGIEVLAKKSNIYTTIDLKMQKILVNVLEQSQKDFDALESFGVIANINGEIIAMHTTKSNKNGKMCDFVNTIYHSVFEFASTCKLFTMLFGFHSQAINEKMMFDLRNGAYIDERRMVDVEAMPDFATTEMIFKKSSNVGTTLIGQTLDKELFFNFLKQLQLNKVIDLQFTQTAHPLFPKNPKKGDILTMCLGYCYATTAINMIKAYLAIFNNGLLINPTLIKNYKTNNRRIHINNLDKMHKLLHINAARHPILARYNCASKTGTAKIMGKKTYTEDVNTFIICVLPDIYGNYKYIILLGLLKPNPPKLAGLCVRNMCVQIVQKIFPFTFNKH